MRLRQLSYVLSTAFSAFGGVVLSITNLAHPSRVEKIAGNTAGSVMLLIGISSCVYLCCTEISSSPSERQKIMSGKRKEQKMISGKERQKVDLFAKLLPEDKLILQSVDGVLKDLSEKKYDVGGTYKCILMLWRELVNYGQKYSRSVSMVDEALRNKMLTIHQHLLEKSTDANNKEVGFPILVFQQMDSGDYFTSLISYDLVILNLNLKENINVLEFLRDQLPGYLEKLKSSQLFKSVDPATTFSVM
jgi:hypothetical protein